MESPFSQVAPRGTAAEAIRQIEALLLEGVLASGDRLPGERELSERLAISRPVLRDALKTLESRGLIQSRHGGGTYVADLVGPIFSPAVADLIARHDGPLRDYLEFRRLLEGEAAERAARRATEADRERLSAVMKAIEEAHMAADFEAEAECDIALHQAIGEAAHNIILMHTLRSCYRLMSLGIFRHRQMLFNLPGAREALFAQHRTLVEAILAGDQKAARKTAEDHIDFVAQGARDVEEAENRERIARLRQSQDQTRKAARAQFGAAKREN